MIWASSAAAAAAAAWNFYGFFCVSALAIVDFSAAFEFHLTVMQLYKSHWSRRLNVYGHRIWIGYTRYYQLNHAYNYASIWIFLL